MCTGLRKGARTAILALMLLPTQSAGADRPGDFDYWLLALSWTPAWCEAEGDGRGDDRCSEGSGWGWTLHGLWPQHETGWPEFCHSHLPDPSRSQTAAMADIMGSAGLAWHQWRKHGRCSGMEATEYFEASRAAWLRWPVPETLSPDGMPAGLDGGAVIDRMQAALPDLPAEAITPICRGRALREIRLCLDRDMQPRQCGADVVARGCPPGPLVQQPLR